LADGQVIVEASDLDGLHDRLYALEAALDDVAIDLAEPKRLTPADLLAALAHLRTVAEDLRGTVIEPVTA